MPTIDLDAFLVAQLLAGKAPSAAPTPTPIFPGPIPSLPGSTTPSPRLSHSVPAITGATPAAKTPPEKILKEWKARWHLARWSKRECWAVEARFTLVSGPGGLPEADLQFTAKPESLADVVRSVFELPPQPLLNDGDGVGPLGQTYACAICKCSGDKECGGGRIHTIWMGKTECNRENKKKAQELCNHDSTFLSICDLDQKRKDGKKCSVHHHDFACSDRETEDKCSNRQQSAEVDEQCGLNPSPTPRGEVTPSKGPFQGKKVLFNDDNRGKHTKVSTCSLKELEKSARKEPKDFKGELSKFVKAVKSGNLSYGSQLGAETGGQDSYTELVRDALENGKQGGGANIEHKAPNDMGSDVSNEGKLTRKYRLFVRLESDGSGKDAHIIPAGK